MNDRGEQRYRFSMLVGGLYVFLRSVVTLLTIGSTVVGSSVVRSTIVGSTVVGRIAVCSTDALPICRYVRSLPSVFSILD